MLATRESMSAQPLRHGSSNPIGDLNGLPATSTFPAHWRHLMNESRPLPPGATDEDHLKWIPRASDHERGTRGPDLGAPFSADELYSIIYPPEKGRPPTVCHPECRLCIHYAEAHSDWRHGRCENAPDHLPHLSTSRAAGPDDLVAEALKWPRPQEGGSRAHFRERVCTTIAAVFNKALAEGRVGHEFVASRITPVPKQNAGNPDPDTYRGISVTGLLAKLLSLCITRRVVHWAVLHELINPAQVGFLPHHSAEEQVWVLTQLLKARNRSGLPTGVLFVDLKKAYDRTHLGALWIILERMGMPKHLTGLLRGLAADKKAAVVVNGVTSDTFDVTAGVPQGDPLSCILFVLFVESLSRRLGSDAPGVSAFPHNGPMSTRIHRLLYADDIAIPFERPDQAQHLVDTVHDWCTAWGHTIGTGQGKTDLVWFPARRGTTALPTVNADGAIVCWAPDYVYLGYKLSSNFNEDGYLRQVLRTIWAGFHVSFTRNRFTRQASVGAQLMTLNTSCLNAANYLRSMVVITPKLSDELDRATLRMARLILGLPKNTSRLLLWGASHLLPTVAVVARERERLLQTLLLSPTPGLARALLIELAFEAPSRASKSGPTANWLHVTHIAREAHTNAGAVPLEPHSYEDISRVAHVFGRSVAAIAVSRAHHANATHAAPQPRSLGSEHHTLSLHPNLREPGWDLGIHHGHTAVSLYGPVCSGSLLALSTSGRYPACTAALLGDESLHLWPLNGRPRNDPAELTTDGTTKRSYLTQYAARFARHTGGECPICPLHAAPSLWHFFNECLSAHLAKWRADSTNGILLILQQLAIR